MSKVTKLAILLTILACGAVVSACGEEDRSHLLPGDSVQEIETNLDTVQQQFNEGLCLDALDSAGEVQNQAERLPRTVDPELKRALIDGAVTLIQLVQENCDETGTTSTIEEPEAVETEPEVTPTGETGTTEEEADEPTGPTGTTGQQNKPQKPVKPTPDPETEPTPPTTPETPTNPDPPVDSGPGSGGITPNQ